MSEKSSKKWNTRDVDEDSLRGNAYIILVGLCIGAETIKISMLVLPQTKTELQNDPSVLPLSTESRE